jgi:hypothetical protein
MQAAIYVRPQGDWGSQLQRYLRARLSWGNAARVGLATMAIVAVPMDLRNQVLSPDPNWPLIAIEPVALVTYLRCTLGSMT